MEKALVEAAGRLGRRDGRRQPSGFGHEGKGFL